MANKTTHRRRSARIQSGGGIHTKYTTDVTNNANNQSWSLYVLGAILISIAIYFIYNNMSMFNNNNNNNNKQYMYWANTPRNTTPITRQDMIDAQWAPVPQPPPAIAVMNSPDFVQTGLLTPTDGSGDVLPLMSRQVASNRNKYQYYTVSNQRNSVKLPILVAGRNGMDEYGVNELSTGDTVLTVGTGTVYTVTLYK